MFNLLSENTKKSIKSEYRLRLLVVVLSFVFFILATLITLVFPSWLISFYEEQDFAAQVDRSNKVVLDTKIQNINKEISFINQTLINIDSKLSYQNPSVYIDRIISEKTDSIRLNEVIHSSVSPDSSGIIVTGLARNRDALLSFVKRLESTEVFSSVVLPISNFTKDRDITFSLNLKVETKKE